MFVQFMITFSVGFVATLALFLMQFGVVQVSTDDRVPLVIRAVGILTIVLVVAYFIGTVIVNALGGFSGLAGYLQ